MLPVRVGFLANSFAGWTGGSNYLRNLLIAIHAIPDKLIEPFLFVNTEVSDEFLQIVEPYVTIIKFGLVYHSSLPFVCNNTLYNWCRRQLLFKKIDALNIDVMSHSNMCGDGHSFLKVNWIPDFQHLHLPEMFTEKECNKRSRNFRDIIIGSDAVVLSSSDAIKDADDFVPGYSEKLHRLAFVSIPVKETQEGGDCVVKLEQKYSFSGKFFYLPNQFWRHKNHKVVFEAVRRLKSQGIEILVVCTGELSDYRNEGHIDKLREFLDEHDLNNNILLLGRIPYKDVCSLFRFALAIINPSQFEGWSSTVEEAKSLGKKIILSNIAVHKEQAPPDAEYFDPMQPEELCGILLKNWKVNSQEIFSFDKISKKNLQERIVAYGSAYQNIILNVTGKVNSEQIV